MAGPLSAAIKGAAAVGKKTAKAAPQVAKKVIPPGLGRGGFDAGSLDEALFLLSKKPDDPTLVQAVQALIGNNTAKRQQAKTIFPQHFGGSPRPTPNPASGPFVVPPGHTVSATRGGPNPMQATVGKPSMFNKQNVGRALGVGGLGVAGGATYAAMKRPSTQPIAGGGAMAMPKDLPEVGYGEDTELSGHEWSPEGFADSAPSLKPKEDLAALMARMEQPVMGRVPKGIAAKTSKPSARGMASPMLSGLTGQNGAGDMSDLGDMNFGAPEVDFMEMFKQADTTQNAEMQPQQQEEKDGNGLMDILKTIGPLLAALFAGKMMK
jgi:hypothetical protein